MSDDMEQKPGLEVRVRRDGMSKLVNPLRGGVRKCR